MLRGSIRRGLSVGGKGADTGHGERAMNLGFTRLRRGVPQAWSELPEER